MNKKLVAFLLSTGILVSTCGTAFADEVIVNDNIPNNTVNAVNPNYINNLITQINKSIDELNKIANELSQIPVANEDDIAKLGEMTDKYIEQLNKATTEADIELIIDDFNKTTKEFVATSGVANRNLTILNDLYREAEVQYKNIHDLLDKLVTVNGSGTAVLELSQQAIELSKSINKIYDTKNSESNKHINNITNELSKCQEKIKKISADITLDGMQNVITDTSNMNNMIDNNVTNLPNNNMINSPNNNATEEPTTDKKDEDNKDEDKPPVDFSNEYIDDDEKFEELTGGNDEKRQEAINKLNDMVSKLDAELMKADGEQEIAKAKAELESIISNVNNMNEVYGTSLTGTIMDKYRAKLLEIETMYLSKIDEIDNIAKEEQNEKATITFEDYKLIYNDLDNYEKKVKTYYETAYAELNTLQAEYQKKIEDAFKAKEQNTTDTTSTYTSRSGNSSSGLSDDYDFGGSSSRTSTVSSVGIKSPKTGDINGLGTGIMGIISSIGALVLARRKL